MQEVTKFGGQNEDFVEISPGAGLPGPTVRAQGAKTSGEVKGQE